MSDLPAFRLERGKRKTVALMVHTDGSLVVRAPLKMALRDVQEIIRQKKDWIRAKQAEFQARLLKHRKRDFAEGEIFPFNGKSYPLKLSPSAPHRVTLESDTLMLHPSIDARPALEAWYKTQAKRVLTARVQALALPQDQYERVRISSARTRWGSCSTRGTLSFSWRLVMAPPAVQDYVVVHELVHLHVKNHQREFWQAVEARLPDYKKQVRWLKDFGYTLDIDTLPPTS
jgi:predicted metal-dependent hydrolase